MDTIQSIQWIPEQPDRPVPGHLRIIDQTRLPLDLVFCDLYSPEEVAAAIMRLAIRGAPLLGIAASYALVLAAQTAASRSQPIRPAVEQAAKVIRRTRPTAVNLFVGVERLLKIIGNHPSEDELPLLLWQEAARFHARDREACTAIGSYGAELIPQRARVLTHCNTGALATGGEGTALAAIYHAHRQGKISMVFAGETRPLWQGARLTAWELQQAQIPVTLICDNAAASLLASGKVDCVLVGADRIALNGDTANKIGTLALAVLARRYNVPFYVLAPTTTIDSNLTAGSDIIIEYRKAEEVTAPAGLRIAPSGVDAYNPAFDVTPGELIDAIVTEKGILRPPWEDSLHRLASGPKEQ